MAVSGRGRQVKIYQVFHREFPVNLSCDWILPIGVGGFSRPSFLSDSTGDNIADRNPSYSEMTAQYWVYRNTSDEYVGICHYRRMFNFLQDTHHRTETPVHSGPEIIPYLTSNAQREMLEDILSVY